MPSPTQLSRLEQQAVSLVRGWQDGDAEAVAFLEEHTPPGAEMLPVVGDRS